MAGIVVVVVVVGGIVGAGVGAGVGADVGGTVGARVVGGRVVVVVVVLVVVVVVVDVVVVVLVVVVVEVVVLVVVGAAVVAVVVAAGTGGGGEVGGGVGGVAAAAVEAATEIEVLETTVALLSFVVVVGLGRFFVVVAGALSFVDFVVVAVVGGEVRATTVRTTKAGRVMGARVTFEITSADTKIEEETDTEIRVVGVAAGRVGAVD